MNNKIVMVAVATALICMPLSFYAGMKYSSAKSGLPGMALGGRNFPGGMNGQMGQMGQMGQRRANGAGFVNGEIVSVGDGTLSIKSRDGGSKIVLVASSTAVYHSEKASLQDLQVGENVMVSGKSGSDGSIVADSVQTRPEMPMPEQR